MARERFLDLPSPLPGERAQSLQSAAIFWGMMRPDILASPQV